MGNSQKAQQQVKVQIVQNLGQFLPNTQVQDAPNDIPINIPIPPTPCFKEDTKIEVIPQEILAELYEQEDKLNEQQQFQIQLKKQDRQIQRAKANYQKRMKDNIQKLKQIQARRLKCNHVFEGVYDSINENNENSTENEQQQTEMIWSSRICTKIVEPMDEYLKNKYPKEQNLDGTEEYKNWHIYKQKMYRDQMQQINDKQQKLKTLEADLKQKYYTLLQRKQQRLNSSKTYATLKEQQSKQTNYYISTPSPKQKKKRQKSSHSANLSPLSPRKRSQNRSQDTTGFDLSQSFQKQTQNTFESPSFFSELIPNLQNSNPQHWSPKSPQVDFLAKQIFYYQNYSSKRRRTSFIYSREEVEKLTLEENQYPSRRTNYERPVRCQENLKDNMTFRSKSKSPKKRTKVKQFLAGVSQQNKQQIVETSLYHKVYEKIPKKEVSMMYSQSDRKFTQVEDCYPYEGSPSRVNEKEGGSFPETIKVNDSLQSSPQKEVLQYRIGPRQKASKLGYDFMERANTGNSTGQTPQLTENQKYIMRKNRSQREYEARILSRLKQKKMN